MLVVISFKSTNRNTNCLVSKAINAVISSLPLWNPAHFGCQYSNNSIYNMDKDHPTVLFCSEFVTPAEIKRKSPFSKWHCRGIDCLAAQISLIGQCLFCEFAKIQSLAFGLWRSRCQVFSVRQDWVLPKLASHWYLLLRKNWAPIAFNQDSLSLLASSVGNPLNHTVLGRPGSREWNVLEGLGFFCKHMPSF